MHRSSSLVLVCLCILFSFVVLGSADVVSNTEIGCNLPLNKTMDYFPIKTTANFAKGFKIKYFLRHKVINNKFTNESFVSYHCGTKVPSLNRLRSTHPLITYKRFLAPLSTIATLDTTSVTFLEYLGKRLAISSVSLPDYVTSSCILARLEENIVVDTTIGPSIQGSFGYYQADPSTPLSISTTPYLETTILGRAEWIKFYAAFFNLEHEANQLFATMVQNFNCIKSFVPYGAKQPVVAWTTFSNYSGNAAWAFSTSLYQQDLTTQAGGVFYAPSTTVYTTAAAFLQASQKVDILIDQTYYSTVGDATIENVLASYGVDSSVSATTHPWINKVYRLDQTISVAYGLDWFDGAVVMADALLGDMMHVLYDSLPVSDYCPLWFRQVASSSPSIITSKQCSDKHSSTTLPSWAPVCSLRPTSVSCIN